MPFIKIQDTAFGAIVNHHLLAPDLIARVFSALASNKIKTIVLISPNHFSRGKGDIISSSYNWKTPYGILQADDSLIRKLSASAGVSIEEDPFKEEHGIFNIAPFIKKSFPDARIAPLIIKDSFQLSGKKDEQASRLNEIIPQDALIIGSFDFSHTLPPQAAEFHDEKALAVLESLDYSETDFLDIDSKPGLYLFLKLMQEREAGRFTLFDHTNSAEILGDPKIDDTTSYITGVFSRGDAAQENRVTLLGFGDLMLDRGVRKAIDKNTPFYPFVPITRFLNGNDITLANLEGGFTDFAPKRLEPEGIAFTFDPSLAAVLSRLGFNIFGLANNHSRDFGASGFHQTQKYLESAEISYFGDWANVDQISVVKTVRGMRIGFVGYHALSRQGFDIVLQETRRLRSEADVLVAVTHWGVEYKPYASADQQKEARQLIDAGADLVLGGHPHVIQPIEIYKGKPIFYSLGNFVFDQTFSAETMEGLAVGAVFYEHSASYYLFPIESRDLQTHLQSYDKSRMLLKKLADDSMVDDTFKSQILDGKMVISW